MPWTVWLACVDMLLSKIMPHAFRFMLGSLALHLFPTIIGFEEGDTDFERHGWYVYCRLRSYGYPEWCLQRGGYSCDRPLIQFVGMVGILSLIKIVFILPLEVNRLLRSEHLNSGARLDSQTYSENIGTLMHPRSDDGIRGGSQRMTKRKRRPSRRSYST